jgi:hypothetical protein
MSIEALFRPDIIIPAIVFAAPVTMYWVKRHYALLEKAIPNEQLPALKERLSLLEAQNAALKARLLGVEAQLHALESSPAPKALPAHDASVSDEEPGKPPR